MIVNKLEGGSNESLRIGSSPEAYFRARIGVQPVLGETYSGTFACYVTGGIVVDNGIPTGTEAGASEIYFMGLNGTAANICANAGGGSLTGVQSAQ